MSRVMIDSGVEWIGKVPENWKIERMKNCIASRTAGAWGEEAQNQEGDCICIRIADFDYDRMTVKKADNYTVRNYSSEVINRLQLKKGDILIEKSGGGEKTPVGRTIIFNEDYDAVYSNFIEKLTVRDIVLPEFMQYIFVVFYKNRYTWNYIKQTTGIQNLDISSMLSKERVAIPKIDEQQRIVNYLNDKCSAIDNVIDKTNASIDDYQKLRKSIVVKAVTKGLNENVPMKKTDSDWIGEIPAHWDYVRIQRLFEEIDERNEDEDALLLSLYTSIGVKPRNELEERGNKAVTVINYKKVKQNDIIVNKLLAWMGAIGYSDYEGVTSPDYDVYRAKKGANVVRTYYNEYFRHTCFNGDCYKYGHGIMLMRWRTYPEELLRIKVPNPPKEEQEAIAKYLEEKCFEIDKLIEKKQAFIEEMEQYKKSLIYEYVTGKKNVE